MQHEDDQESRRVDEPEAEQRSLSQALATGATSFVGTLGALGAKDLYGKAKEKIRPSEEKPEVILPPGTKDE